MDGHYLSFGNRYGQLINIMLSKTAPLLLVTLFLLHIISSSPYAAGDFDKSENMPLPRVSPSSIGWSAEKLSAAMNFAQQIGSAAVIAISDGRIFLSWGFVDRKYRCHSIWKPFLSALYGIYVNQGLIDLSSSLGDLRIDDLEPGLSKSEKSATVKDLLTSRSGIYHPAAAETDAMRKKRPHRNTYVPGTHFFYNSWDVNALITIFESQTGKSVCHAFNEQIAKPIGMLDLRQNDCSTRYEPEKSIHPSLHLRMTANDMARFGLLIQQYGNWNNKQIIPKKWIAESTKRYSIIDRKTGEGYGYLWRLLPSFAGMNDVIFHTGHGVHLMAILPKDKLVIVHRVDTDTHFRIQPADVEALVYRILDARSK